MHRPGTDESNVQMSDILCDFCAQQWTESRPMVEGHRGACICGTCLTQAYRDLVLRNVATAPTGYQCKLCLEKRADRGWQSAILPESCACVRCIKQSAGVLTKDPDLGWKKPQL